MPVFRVLLLLSLLSACAAPSSVPVTAPPSASSPLPSSTPTPADYWRRLNGNWATPSPTPQPTASASPGPSASPRPRATASSAPSGSLVVVPMGHSSSTLITPEAQVDAGDLRAGYFEGWATLNDTSQSLRCRAVDPQQRPGEGSGVIVRCDDGDAPVFCRTNWESVGAKMLGELTVVLYALEACGVRPPAPPEDPETFLERYNADKNCRVQLSIPEAEMRSILAESDPAAILDRRFRGNCVGMF
ncbi:MAG: hypothetical protein ACO1RX_19475 [Candidatus Sericytochromatia bacterium]